MYRSVFIGGAVAMISAAALFLWALSKEIEAFCEMEAECHVKD